MVLLSPKNSPGLLAALTIALSTMTVSSALTQAVPAPLKTTTEKNLGTFLVDSKGMTLYIFDDDKGTREERVLWRMCGDMAAVLAQSR